MTTLEHVAGLPLTAGLIALASERVRAYAARSLPLASLLVPACWLVRALDVGRFDPVAFVLVVALSVGSVVALGHVGKANPKLTLVDLLVAVVLFLPLDLRWTNRIYPGGGGYNFFALALTYLAILGWGCAPRELPGFGHRAPNLRDVKIGLLAFLAFGLLAVPLGYALGFLKKASLAKFELGQAAAAAWGYVFMVALPEEVVFRGVLDRGLQATLRSKWTSIVLSSLLFGLMHLPRRGKVVEQIAYVVMAFVAGLFYAAAFRKSEGLPAAVICHASIDWFWEQIWKRDR